MKTGLMVGAAALTLAAGTSLGAVTFTDLELGNFGGNLPAVSFVKGGVTLNATTSGGAYQGIPSGGFAGLWFSQNSIADAVYTLDFNGAGMRTAVIAIDAMSGVGPGEELLSQWSTTGGTPSVTINNAERVDIGGSDLASLSIQCQPGQDNGKFTLTLTSAVPFTSISFRHTQNPVQFGSVIELVTVDTVPAPGAACIASIGGLALLRRRR